MHKAMGSRLREFGVPRCFLRGLGIQMGVRISIEIEICRNDRLPPLRNNERFVEFLRWDSYGAHVLMASHVRQHTFRG